MALTGDLSGSYGKSSIIGITGSLDLTYDGEGTEDGWIQLREMTGNPGNPSSNQGKLFIKDNGSGTTVPYFLDSGGTVTSLLGGGSSSPAGSDSQVQYNNGGSVGGASSLVYDDTNGRVGIGTDSPSATLEVSGTLKITGGDEPALLMLDDQDGSAQIGRAHVGYVGSSDFAAFAHQDRATTTEYCVAHRSNGQTDINTSAGTNMTFRYASAIRAQLDTNGYFSVGSNYAPGSHKFAVEGDALIEGDLTVNQYIYHNGDADTYIRFQDNDVRISTAGTERVTVDSNGKVGIGQTTPTKTLTIEFANDNTAITTGHGFSGGASGDGLLIENTSTTTNAYANLDFRVATADGRIAYVYDGTSNSGDFHFVTDNANSPASRLIIKDGGSVGIGAEPSATYLLDVAGATRAYLSSGDTTVATRECARFTHLSTGTPAAGFGTFIGFGLENTNSEEISAGGMGCAWINPTDGAESSQLEWATNQAGSQMNQMTLDAYGLTVHAATYGAVTGLSTQALAVRGNKYADYACLFHNDGNATTRYGVKIQCGTDDNSGTNYAVVIADGDGSNQGYITFSGGTVTYGAFTGVHDAAVQSSDYTAGNDSYNYGTIVKIISTSSPLPKKVAYVVGPTTSAEDKSAFGVYSGYAPPPDDPSGNSHQIFAIGDGHILVCNEGGDIEIGDYICSSGTRGHGKKQSSAQLYNYTVAKATEAVTWENEDSNSKLISCTYHSA